MTQIRGDFTAIFKGEVRQLEASDYAEPSEWNDTLKILIDNDAMHEFHISYLRSTNIDARLTYLENAINQLGASIAKSKVDALEDILVRAKLDYNPIKNTPVNMDTQNFQYWVTNGWYTNDSNDFALKDNSIYLVRWIPVRWSVGSDYTISFGMSAPTFHMKADGSYSGFEVFYTHSAWTGTNAAHIFSRLTHDGLGSYGGSDVADTPGNWELQAHFIRLSGH